MARPRKLDHDKVRELLRQGLTMNAVAERMGTTWSAIRYVHRAGFKQLEAKRRGHRRVSDGRKDNGFGVKKLSDEMRDEIYKSYWESGREKTHRELAEEYGVAMSTIRRIVNRHLGFVD
jgi:uncharacterized protein YjcR